MIPPMPNSDLKYLRAILFHMDGDEEITISMTRWPAWEILSAIEELMNRRKAEGSVTLNPVRRGNL